MPPGNHVGAAVWAGDFGHTGHENKTGTWSQSETISRPIMAHLGASIVTNILDNPSAGRWETCGASREGHRWEAPHASSALQNYSFAAKRFLSWRRTKGKAQTWQMNRKPNHPPVRPRSPRNNLHHPRPTNEAPASRTDGKRAISDESRQQQRTCAENAHHHAKV